jgi:hypothetical protein
MRQVESPGAYRRRNEVKRKKKKIGNARLEISFFLLFGFINHETYYKWGRLKRFYVNIYV